MGDWNLGLGTLSEAALGRLADMLDNSNCGWRQLAAFVSEQPRFKCSESELTSCSLQVLSPTGSPGKYLLARLADRSCTLALLLHCLKKMDYHEAIQYLTAAVMEQIRLTQQPKAQKAAEGDKVVLSCRAVGPSGLAFQWFRGKEEIQGGNSPDLVLCPFTFIHQGHYICRVNHGESCAFSTWATVRLAPAKGSSPGSSYLPTSVSGLQIVCQPQHQAVSEGDSLCLECYAEANPPAQYQWYHNKEPTPYKTGKLKITCVTTAHRGEYRCRVFNLYHEAWSNAVQLKIGPSSVAEASWAEVDPSFATDKVALLMGSMNYQHHTPLRAPMADVHELTSLLRQLDFKVVSLLDLNWQEMHSAVTEFLLLLDRGVYGLLYYAGHGYENYGNSFMVPIDAPASYTSEHCLWVQDVLQRMQERETGLNVFLLDMCRKRNLNDDIIQLPEPLKVTANIVFGYATCVDAEAYEVEKDDLSNGIFVRFLKLHLLEEEKVTVMLDRVAEDMGRCEITRGRQALELRSNLSERRALTDRIQSSDCPATSARNLQWAIAHVLPDSCNLQFDCGVRVQLGFAAEFSNIMIIYTRILEKPKDIVSCSAQLTDFSEGVDIDLKNSNQKSLVEAGSLLVTMDDLPSPELPCLYTRIKGLQRLKTELKFTARLHYRYSHLDEDIQETQVVTVGKPLVSKLNLYEPRLPRSCSFDPLAYSVTESSSFAGNYGTGSQDYSVVSELTSTCWSYKSNAGGELGSSAPSTSFSSRRVNVPEETLSTELFESPQPLTASKSLPYGHTEDVTYKISNMYNFHSL
ncbi:MALT paracaspase 2 [Aplochiton taeniatus]